MHNRCCYCLVLLDSCYHEMLLCQHLHWQSLQHYLILLCDGDVALCVQAVTLLGLWLIPIYFALRLFWFRMLAIWTLFSLITGYIIFKATSKSMEGTTPRYTKNCKKTDRWTDKQTDGWTNRQTAYTTIDRQTDKRTDRCIDRWMDRETDRQTDKRIHRQTERRMAGQTDR